MTGSDFLISTPDLLGELIEVTLHRYPFLSILYPYPFLSKAKNKNKRNIIGIMSPDGSQN